MKYFKKDVLNGLKKQSIEKICISLPEKIDPKCLLETVKWYDYKDCTYGMIELFLYQPNVKNGKTISYNLLQITGDNAGTLYKNLKIEKHAFRFDDYCVDNLHIKNNEIVQSYQIHIDYLTDPSSTTEIMKDYLSVKQTKEQKIEHKLDQQNSCTQK